MAEWDEMALVGRVARAHGIRGQVIVNLETDFPEERFKVGGRLFVKRGEAIESVHITTVRFHRDRPVVGLAGIDDMNTASALAGAELRVPVDELAVLPEGTFYRHDLVGCRVETAAGEPIGTVSEVEGDVGRSRLVVRRDGGEDVLVPLASEICRTIDTVGRRIVVDPPAGLIELNRPGGEKA
jgi:16S rRNA processing protein RimM